MKDYEFVLKDPDPTDPISGDDRGYRVARLNAYLPDSQVPPNAEGINHFRQPLIPGYTLVGYIVVTWIPLESWREKLPTAWHYAYLFGGHTNLKGYILSGLKEDLIPAVIRWGLHLRTPEEIEAVLQSEYRGHAKGWNTLRRWIVNKPYVDYIRVDTCLQGMGLGTELYTRMAKHLARSGLKLHASTMQSDAAKKAWNSMVRKGLPVKRHRERRVLDFTRMKLAPCHAYAKRLDSQ